MAYLGFARGLFKSRTFILSLSVGIGNCDTQNATVTLLTKQADLKAQNAWQLIRATLTSILQQTCLGLLTKCEAGWRLPNTSTSRSA